MYPYANPSFITKGINLLKTMKWADFLDGTSKTLGVINQAIPVVYQVKPIMNNAKTLFKIANIMNTPTTNETTTNNKNNNSPIFYI